MKGRKMIVQKAEHAKNNKRAFHIIKTHACCYKWFIINVYYKRSITNEFIIVALLNKADVHSRLSEREKQGQHKHHHNTHYDLKGKTHANVVHKRVTAGLHDKSVWRR